MVSSQDLVTSALARGYQIRPDAMKILQDIEGIDYDEVLSTIIRKKQNSTPEDFTIDKEDLVEIISNYKSYNNANLSDEAQSNSSFEIIKDVRNDEKPLEGIDGYLTLFKSRLNKFMRIAKQRPDLFQAASSDELESGNTGRLKIAGLLTYRKNKRDRVQITIESEGGSLSVVALDSTNRRKAISSLLDQMILVEIERSKSGRNILKDLRSLDIPDRPISSSKKVVYGVFLSDIHVGCKTFLRDSFERFLLWLSDKSGEDREIVRRIKYVVIAGDLVDGIGVYPGQEDELEERNIINQYEIFASLIERVPKDIRVFITPGNHDATRQALPQFAIPEKYAKKLYQLENITMLGDPAEIRLHGINVLIYHGQSLPDVVSSTPNQSFDRPASAMKVLLKARHLAPTYGRATSFAPEKNDRLVIESVPDIFHCGHIHTLDSDIYKGTLLLNSGTWQSQTKYQQYMGIVPVPAVAPIVNLSTFDVLTKNFL